MKTTPFAAALLLAGCAALRPPHIVENRFRAEQEPLPYADRPVVIAVSTAEAEPAAGGIPITQLSDRGQAALIEQTKGKPPVALKKGSDGPGAVVFQNSLTRRVVISIRPRQFLSSGDRIDAIRVGLRLAPVNPEEQWRIANWTQASNGETVIEVGKLTGVSSSKISATTGVNLSKVLPDLTIAGEASRSDTQEFQVRDVTAFDAAVDASGAAWLDETAGWRANLAHNLSMDVVAAAPPKLAPLSVVTLTSLTQEEGPAKGLPTPAAGVRIGQTTVYVAAANEKPICGIANLTYRIRHIAKAPGRATFSESDDEVQYIVGDDQTRFMFAPPPYQPTYEVDAAGLDVQYKLAGQSARAIRFLTLEEATAFRNWLQTVRPKRGKIANATLGIVEARDRFRPLTANDFGSLFPKVANAAAAQSATRFDPAKCAQPT